MPYPKLSGAQQQGPQASGDAVDVPVVASLTTATQTVQGQCYSYDQTNLVMPDGIPNNEIFLLNQAIFLSKGPRVVLPTSANAAGLSGAQTNVTFTSATGATTLNPLTLRMWGHGLVLAGVLGAGTTVKVGNQLSFSAFPTASSAFALAAANAAVAQGLFVGVAQAGYVQTQMFLNSNFQNTIPAGAQTVILGQGNATGAATIANPGVFTPGYQGQVLTFDVPSSGVQETPAAGTPTAASSANTLVITFANAHAAGTFVVGPVNAVAAAANIMIAGSAGNVTGPITAFIFCNA